MMCWNVRGWCKDGSGMEQMREVHDMRAEVLDFYKPDVVALVETWLKGEEEIGVKGYRWFGRNRRRLHRKAVRGLGGVGLLVHEEVLERYAVEVFETDVEDVLWVRLGQENEECLLLAICYVPPEMSSWGRGAEETFQLLAEQVAKFGAQGPLIVCGDFNVRCGRMETHSKVVNGRKGRDAFTCVSEKGCSVVDYCIVGCDYFKLVENFTETTMSESVEMGCRGGCHQSSRPLLPALGGVGR